ncbi:MAG: EamA family transporter [Spirochaetaceae bacterium]|nr:EamA family transporter [Spirochaetaceae bacterium]
MWAFYAALSAFFAALTSVLGKIGVENVNSHLAVALRTLAVLGMAWALAWISGARLAAVSRRSLLFLLLSGITAGLSWLCYYRALQLGEASKVMPVDKLSLVIGIILAYAVLKEPVTPKTIIGAGLITIGTFVLIR